MLFAGYRALTTMAGPLVEWHLARRARRGKEDPARAGERRGVAARPRPEGAVVWLHAASVGESLSVLPLVERLAAERPGAAVLVTTGTVTSARLLAERLPAGALHQYAPVDRAPWVDRFLAHWRPELALWVESELWPNLVSGTQARAIPMLLINGRMSERSFRLWRQVPRLVGPMLEGFALCLAQTEEDAARLRALGARAAKSIGNLKYAAPPLDADERALAVLSDAFAGRPRWLAASTHRGEEEQVAGAHLHLRKTHAGLVTILAPRHPERGSEIAGRLAGMGLAVARRSAGDPLQPATDIYLADTMGELGLLYRLAEVVFVGGSLVPHGGQNLLEPARLDCAILHGPHMHNFRAIADEMRRAGATAEVSGAADLAIAAGALLDEPALRRARARAAAAVAGAQGGVLDALLREIAPWLEALPGRAANPAPMAHAHA